MTNPSTTESTTTESTTAIVDQIAIELLDPKAKLADVVKKLNEVIEALNARGTSTAKARDRGPDSTRDMVEDDARRILLGDMKDVAHKDAANKLGLSYGQVYSSRKGFTFKNIYKEHRDSLKVEA